MQELSYRSWLNKAQEKCKISGVELTAPLILLGYYTKKDKSYLIAFDENILSQEDCIALDALLNRRLNNEPIAYITENKEFYGRNYFVNSHVLIPRPESEMLIDEALSYFNSIVTNHQLLLCDIGTGSGCLAISAVLELHNSHCLALDICKEALEVAKVNAKSNNAENLIDFKAFDILKDRLQNVAESTQFDCIISNPPYIPQNEYIQLEKNVFDYEPKHALTSGESGFEVIDQVLFFAKEHLKKNGLLLIEHGYNQHENLYKRAKAYLGEDWALQSLKDYSGNWRVFKAIKLK